MKQPSELLEYAASPEPPCPACGAGPDDQQVKRYPTGHAVRSADATIYCDRCGADVPNSMTGPVEGDRYAVVRGGCYAGGQTWGVNWGGLR